MIYCLDTNICIYALKGQFEGLRHKLKEHIPAEIKIPSLVRAELLCGAKKSNSPQKSLEVIERFLFPFDIFDFDKSASEVYAEIRYETEKNGTSVGPNDLIIAATAISHHAILVTHNVKEFSHI